MKTVLRNDEGVITHIHLEGNQYVTPNDHKIITETEITLDMLNKINPNNSLVNILNGVSSVLAVKKVVLFYNGVKLDGDDKFL